MVQIFSKTILQTFKILFSTSTGSSAFNAQQMPPAHLKRTVRLEQTPIYGMEFMDSIQQSVYPHQQPMEQSANGSRECCRLVVLKQVCNVQFAF